MGATALIALSVASLVAGAANTAVAAVQARRRADETEDASRRAAAQLRARGLREAELSRRESRRLLGQQRALAGSSGLTSDSFFDLLVDTAMREEEAAQRVFERFNFAATDQSRQGALAASQLRSRSRQTIIGGTANFLSGATRLGLSASGRTALTPVGTSPGAGVA